MEKQLNKMDLEFLDLMHKLEEKYGSIQGIITSCERMKVSRKEKQAKKTALKFFRTIQFDRNHKNIKSKGVA